MAPTIRAGLCKPQAQARPYGAVPGGIIVACGFNAGGGLTMTNDAINDGRPHRILFTYSAQSGRRLYVDGVLNSRDYASSGGPVYNSSELHVGSRAGDAGLPAGSLISAFAIFQSCLVGCRGRCGLAVIRVHVHAVHAAASPPVCPGPSPVSQGLQAMSMRTVYGKLIDVSLAARAAFTARSRKGRRPMCRCAGVRLHRSVDGYLARETWSKADGSYEFREISTRYEWDVIAWDHELQEYSTVANNQLAEVA
jgi:hypothetical protein